MDAVEVAKYTDEFGVTPVPHRGETGIKEAIDQIFTSNGFPQGTELDLAQKQKLVDDLRQLYKTDNRFSQLKLWPITRDWLLKHADTQGLIIGD